MSHQIIIWIQKNKNNIDKRTKYTLSTDYQISQETPMTNGKYFQMIFFSKKYLLKLHFFKILIIRILIKSIKNISVLGRKNIVILYHKSCHLFHTIKDLYKYICCELNHESTNHKKNKYFKWKNLHYSLFF